MTKSVKKINVKERVDDDTIDLSLSDISEVPVKDIALHKRATNLDLSNNKIVSLGNNFGLLTHLVKLDLSKNQIISLPEAIGKLVNLRHLDLYNNKLEHLPLEMGKMKSLRYLDLKGNPLTTGLLKVVGHCLTVKECQLAAKTIVPFLTQLQIQIYEDRDRLRKQKAEHEAEQKRLELESELQRLARAETEVNGVGGEHLEPAPKKLKPKRERKQKNALFEEETLETKSSVSVRSDQHDANVERTNQCLKLFIFLVLTPIVAVFLITNYADLDDGDNSIAYIYNIVRPFALNLHKLIVQPFLEIIMKGFAIVMDFNHSILGQLSSLISS